MQLIITNIVHSGKLKTFRLLTLKKVIWHVPYRNAAYEWYIAETSVNFVGRFLGLFCKMGGVLETFNYTVHCLVNS